MVQRDDIRCDLPSMGRPKPLTKWEKFWQLHPAATLLFVLGCIVAVSAVLFALWALVLCN